MTTFQSFMANKAWVDKATILRGEVGSGVHGVALEGKDDRDEMGVCIEPLEVAWSTEGEFDQSIFRTAAEREKKHDAPSQPGDLDLTIFSLRKWVRLTLQGNPTSLLLLFLPQKSIVTQTSLGTMLMELAPAFASRQAIARFLGYMQSQRQRLAGERGQKNVNRHDLVEKFGFDCKYASHVIRLGYQGVEYAETGRLTLPMAEPMRQRVREVKSGAVSLNDVLTEAGILETRLKDLRETSPLPEFPETDRINEWMRDAYMGFWHSDWSQRRFKGFQ